MEISNIISRIRKNPETIPIKLIRFLKRLTPQKEYKIKEIRKYKINNNSLIINTIEDKEIIKEADKILNHEYKILGKIYTINSINWHQDYNSGYIWPKEKYLDLDKDDTDKKIPWELSRFQHFLTLSLAYKQTKEDKYYLEFETQILYWIKENPLGLGINWSTPMECSIRAINLIQAYLLFEQRISDNIKQKIITLIYNHGNYIRNNLEWSPAKENHYIADLTGLFFIGIFFNKSKWILFSKKELEKEILKQVSEDGVDYEASLNYHRLVTEMFLLILILSKKNNIEFSNIFKMRVENMCNFIIYYTPNSGNAPQFGDTDNSRILDIWNKNINDHRDLLTIASVLFNRGNFKSKGKYHKKLALLIDKKEFDKLESEEIILTSKAFKDYYIIRDKELFIMIHCGHIGRNNFGGHGHNDQLSFVLSYDKDDFIIDSGTYCYTSDKLLRHKFRSTSYHNTLLINNEEQAEIQINSPFDMKFKHPAICDQFEEDEKEIMFIGHQNNFKRKIIYNKLTQEIIIEDKTNKESNLQFNLHLHPSIKATKKENKYSLNYKIKIITEDSSLVTTKYSSSYDQIEDSNSISIKKYGNYLKTIIQF